MKGQTHRFIETNGIRMHVAEQGAGPLVLLCHGLPELWYSWRHQLSALAAAGFHAVAPDMRGYGQTDRFLPSMRSADARRSHLDNNSGSRNKKSRLFKVLSSNNSQLNIFGWTIR